MTRKWASFVGSGGSSATRNRSVDVVDFVRGHPWQLAAVAVLAGVLFWPVLRNWARDCWELEDFTHCLLVPVVSAAILIAHRKRLGRAEHGPGGLGLAVACASVTVYFAGQACAYNVVERAGAYGTMVGLVYYLFGGKFFWRNAFPFLYLALAIPIPFVYYSRISIALRGLVTAVSASLLQMLGLPAINDANVLVIGELRLGVVDACSGIRSVMAIFAVAVLFAYLFRAGLVRGAILVALTVPIAVLMNIVRVLVMSYALFRLHLDLTDGVLHEILGLSIFGLILASMFICWIFVKWLLAPWFHSPESAVAA